MQIPLPDKLIDSLQHCKGFDKEAFEKIHHSGEQITSLRVNPAKLTNDHQGQLAKELGQLVGSKVPWSSLGYYLRERPAFTLDPFFHAGVYYVQEPSSMFLEQALKQTVDMTKPLRVLDLCAAPGGKSALIQSLLNENSLLIANEVIKSRVSMLTENMIKWGASNVVVANNDPKDFSRLQNYFDVILVDAPCSGSGLFRKEPEAINEWSLENVNLCSRRQQRILADVWPSLKQQGILIYSTCSYSMEEDEDVLEWIVPGFGAEGLRLKLDEDWNIVETFSKKTNSYGYRFYPDKLPGEGFFIAAVQKKDGSDFYLPPSKKVNAAGISKKEESILKKWIGGNAAVSFFLKNELFYAVPSFMRAELNFLQSALYVKKAGVLLGKIAHDQFIPEHEFALSTLINDEIQSLHLSKNEALDYLRKKEIPIASTLKGWTLVKYENKNLGWIKILQHRINNYYPPERRIRNK